MIRKTLSNQTSVTMNENCIFACKSVKKDTAILVFNKSVNNLRWCISVIRSLRFSERFEDIFKTIKMEEDKALFISGPKLDLSQKDKFLGEFLFNSLRMQEMDKPFQVVLDKNEQMTFGELFQLGAQICQALLQQGLEKGDIVTLGGCNSNTIHALFTGITWAGGVPHPIGSDLKLAEVKNILQQVKPKWVFCEAEDAEVISSSLKTISHDAKIALFGPRSSLDKDYLRLEDILVEVNLNTFTPQKIDNPDNLAIVLCSSGTTGFQKCVGLSHSFLLNVHLWDYIDGIDIKKPYLLTSSFSWITGVFFLILSCICGSFRAITTSNKPSRILKAIQDYKLYGAMIPPSVIKSILDSQDLGDYDVSSLKEVWTGGSPLGENTIEKFQKAWPDKILSQCYGLTEAGGLVTQPAARHYPTSIGRILHNTDVKIEDPESHQSLGPNECGEICIRSHTLLKTYIGNEEAVKSTLKNGWLHTGDIGYYCEDGHLFITTRIKEIMKIDNHQISPIELEAFISSLPGVEDAGVAGISTGEYFSGLMALVVKSPNSTVTAEHISRKVEENFSANKRLTAGVHFVDSLPRSVSGKIRRKYLSEMAESLYRERKEA